MLKNLYAFKWDEIASQSLCRKVEMAVGIDDGPVERVDSLIQRILSKTGGLPLSQSDLSSDDCTALGEQLLLEAFRHTLHSLTVRRESRGYFFRDHQVIDVDKVNANSADSDALIALPGIGKKLAELIIEERLSHGMFLSIDDVEKRVKGFGESLTRNLHHVLFCESPAESLNVISYDATDISACLYMLFSFTHLSDIRARLLRALEIVASTCAASPHPSVSMKLLRNNAEHQSNMHTVDELMVLSGTSYYYKILDLINAASQSISVCMFHIAMSGEKHPTMKLVMALIEAHERNVEVRVLVDKDEKTDPYNSEIINQPVLDLLTEHGVMCRSDARDRLLHSKFLIIDNSEVIIGSHNWSAGSYFQFDDTSALITSADFAKTMSQRFQNLWDEAPV